MDFRISELRIWVSKAANSKLAEKSSRLGHTTYCAKNYLQNFYPVQGDDFLQWIQVSSEWKRWPKKALLGVWEYCHEEQDRKRRDNWLHRYYRWTSIWVLLWKFQEEYQLYWEIRELITVWDVLHFCGLSQIVCYCISFCALAQSDVQNPTPCPLACQRRYKIHISLYGK